jgi:aminopeptidase N
MKLAFLALLFLVALGQEKPWTPFNDPENRHHPERKSAYDVQHYRIQLKVDELDPKHEVEGRLDVDLVLTEETDTLELDAADMRILETSGPEGNLKHRLENGKLAVSLGGPHGRGIRFKLGVKYVATPTSGLYFVEPDAANPRKPRMVWSQGETEYNHHWFPCYDYPNDRATTEVILTVREKYRTISNGALVKSETKDGWRTDHWKMDIPHVAYLTSIVVGEFDVAEDFFHNGTAKVPVRYFVPKGWSTIEEIRHTFAKTPAMMKFFSDRTGVPYPYAQYAQVVVEDFIWGGMENITATTLHPGTVVKKRAWMDRDSDGLIAHELAHQWFGDLVTCRTWGHAWLNEGFATYMDALWRESVGGREALVADLEDGAGWYFREAAEEHARPTACEYFTWPDDQFDSHIYPRGAWILHMLRTLLGDAAWWKGVNLYLTRFQEACVTTDDFRKSMEEASGRDLKPFFDQWVFKVGHPEFQVRQAWDAAKKKLTLTVKQTQKVGPLKFKDLVTERPVFRVPVDIEIETASGRKTHRIEIRDLEQTFSFDVDSEPLIVDFDRDGAVLKKLEFKKGTSELAVQLERDDQAWHRWWAARELAGKEDGVAALGSALLRDPSKTVRIAAAGALREIKGDAARTALLAGLNLEDAKVRRAVIEALAAHADGAAADLEKIFAADPSPACRGAAAASLGKSKGPVEILGQFSKYLDDEIVLPGILTGLLESGDPKAVDAFVRATNPGLHPQIRVRATECLGDALKKTPSDVGRSRLVALLDDASFRVRRKAIEKAGALGDKSLAPALEARIPKETDKRVVQELKDAVRKLQAGS